MSRDEPIYNIGVVARMTDIPAATLRVWERRYGFPDTSRTEGGHRLYSEEDIQRLRWVKARIDEGMQTRQAVRALKSLEDEGALLDPGLMIAEPEATNDPLWDGQEIEADSYIELLQRRLFDTLVRHDTSRADDLFNEALAQYSPEDVMLQMIRPTLREIGEGWVRGNIKIGTEHLATGYLRQRLLAWLRGGPPLYSVPPTVLACAPGEYHEGSLMIFGALMRRRRWPVAYLGQSIPLPDLASFVEMVNPIAIVTVAMTEEPAAELSRWPEVFPDIARAGRPIFAYGGMIFNIAPEWRARVPGLFLGATLTEGVEALERILRRTTLQVES
jgi:MerR family transcriptional regulator, light-induced transcriptional regulator